MSVEDHLRPGELILISSSPFHATTQRLLRYEAVGRRERIEGLEYPQIGSVIRGLRRRKQTVFLGFSVLLLALVVGPPGQLKMLFALAGLLGVLVGLLNRSPYVEFWDRGSDRRKNRLRWRLRGAQARGAGELVETVGAAMDGRPLSETPGPAVPAPQEARPLRSILLLPADRPDQLPPALDLRPDALCLDLAETVEPARRDLARQFVWGEIVAASRSSSRVLVRISSPEALGELEVAVWAGLSGVIVPLHDPQEVHRLEEALETLERARGLPTPIRLLAYLQATTVDQVRQIVAASARIEAVVLGPRDLDAVPLEPMSRDVIEEPPDLAGVQVRLLGLLGTAIPLEQFRQEPAVHSAALLAAAQKAWRRGFRGALTPHPQGVEACRTGFSEPEHSSDGAQESQGTSSDEAGGQPPYP